MVWLLLQTTITGKYPFQGCLFGLNALVGNVANFVFGLWLFIKGVFFTMVGVYYFGHKVSDIVFHVTPSHLSYGTLTAKIYHTYFKVGAGVFPPKL